MTPLQLHKIYFGLSCPLPPPEFSKTSVNFFRILNASIDNARSYSYFPSNIKLLNFMSAIYSQLENAVRDNWESFSTCNVIGYCGTMLQMTSDNVIPRKTIGLFANILENNADNITMDVNEGSVVSCLRNLMGMDIAYDEVNKLVHHIVPYIDRCNVQYYDGCNIIFGLPKLSTVSIAGENYLKSVHSLILRSNTKMTSEFDVFKCIRGCSQLFTSDGDIHPGGDLIINDVVNLIDRMNLPEDKGFTVLSMRSCLDALSLFPSQSNHSILILSSLLTKYITNLKITNDVDTSSVAACLYALRRMDHENEIVRKSILALTNLLVDVVKARRFSDTSSVALVLSTLEGYNTSYTEYRESMINIVKFLRHEYPPLRNINQLYMALTGFANIHLSNTTTTTTNSSTYEWDLLANEIIHILQSTSLSQKETNQIYHDRRNVYLKWVPMGLALPVYSNKLNHVLRRILLVNTFIPYFHNIYYSLFIL